MQHVCTSLAFHVSLCFILACRSRARNLYYAKTSPSSYRWICRLSTSWWCIRCYGGIYYWWIHSKTSCNLWTVPRTFSPAVHEANLWRVSVSTRQQDYPSWYQKCELSGHWRWPGQAGGLWVLQNDWNCHDCRTRMSHTLRHSTVCCYSFSSFSLYISL